MSVRDRLYGAIELPALVSELAECCPVLQRLREVRMANIPFATFPSFANVTRFEHSIGVAHLAWRFARSQELPEDQALALTLAALYHDGASPAFGHLYEEFLIADGFDHEQALVDLLIGSDTLHGRTDAQVFLGRRCRLKTKVPMLQPSSPLSCHGIAMILGGRDSLSSVIAGSIDLDNIDNVIRAASAMGLPQAEIVHPYEILDALTIENGRLVRNVAGGDAIARWQIVREELYSAILANNFEFRCQSATKWAIALASESEPRLAECASWTLTEPELVFEHLRTHSQARELIDGVRLGAPPPLLVRIEVDDVSPLLDRAGLPRLHDVALEITALVRKPTFINFYVDKGPRPVDLPLAGEPTDLAFGGQSEMASGRRALAGAVGVIVKTGDGPYVRRRHGPGHTNSEELSALLIEHLGLRLRAPVSAQARRHDSEQLPIFA
jgi:hypothetical protein